MLIFGIILLGCLVYNAADWQVYPSLADIHCIAVSNRHVYLAVDAGLCILDREDLRLEKTLRQPDGLEGRVRLCAWFPGRNALYVTTDTGVYEFVPATGALFALSAPFQQVSSIGVTQAGVYFDTDKGLYRKRRVAPVFELSSEPSGEVTWYGTRDSVDARDFPVLMPYFFLDEGLRHHPLTLVTPDRRSRRLFVAAQGLGLLVYDGLTGFVKQQVRFGPPQGKVRRIVELDGRLWFLADDRTATWEPTGGWQYFATGPGELAQTRFRLLLPGVLDLDRREQIRTVWADSLGLVLGTSRGLYTIAAGQHPELVMELRRRVNAIARIRDSLLIGTDDGLFLSAGDSMVSVVDPDARFDWGVHDIAIAPDGTVFFGVLGGIVMLTPRDTWATLIPPGHHLGQPIRSLSASGNLLLYGSSSGVGILDRQTGIWHQLGPEQGMPPSNITALHADDRFIWVAAQDIIARYDYRTGLR